MLKVGDYRKLLGLKGNIYMKAPGVACEVEVEYPRDYRVPTIEAIEMHDQLANWSYTLDGSLRNKGIEYVNRKPKNIRVITTDLRQLLDSINRETLADPDASRAGFHVHCNAQHMTLLELFTSITTIWLMESVVSFYTGRLREGNLFCVRQVDGSHQVRRLATLIAGANNRFINNLSDENNYKYGSLNLATLYKFGSLEHRMMKGLVTEPDRLLAWTQYCHDVTYEHGFQSPCDVLDNFIETYRRGDLLDGYVLKFFEGSPYTHMRDAVIKRYQDQPELLGNLMFEASINLLHLGYIRSTTDGWSKLTSEFNAARSVDNELQRLRNMIEIQR